MQPYASRVEKTMDELPNNVSPRSNWRWLKIVAGVVALLSAVFLGTIVVLMLQSPPLPPVQTSAASAIQFRNSFVQGTNDAALGNPHPVTATELELNSLLADMLQSNGSSADSNSGFKLNDMRIKLHEDVFDAFIILDYHGKKLTIELNGKIKTERGYSDLPPVLVRS